MSASGPINERLLTFEVDQGLYALPIRGVLEVAESALVTSVPMLSRDRCGVMNWHGDALPVISPEILLQGATSVSDEDAAEAELRTPESIDDDTPGEAEPGAKPHVLVVSDRGELPKLGLPIDSVQGLVDGVIGRTRGLDLVLERRSIDGRVVCVLDPRGLVNRAEAVIEEMVL